MDLNLLHILFTKFSKKIKKPKYLFDPFLKKISFKNNLIFQVQLKYLKNLSKTQNFLPYALQEKMVMQDIKYQRIRKVKSKTIKYKIKLSVINKDTKLEKD